VHTVDSVVLGAAELTVDLFAMKGHKEAFLLAEGKPSAKTKPKKHPKTITLSDDNTNDKPGKLRSFTLLSLLTTRSVAETRSTWCTLAAPKKRKPRTPASSAERWSRDELQRLFRLCDKYKKGNYGHPDWARILPSFPGRTMNALQAQLSHRWKQNPRAAGGTTPLTSASKPKRKLDPPSSSSDDEIVRNSRKPGDPGKSEVTPLLTTPAGSRWLTVRSLVDLVRKRARITKGQRLGVKQAVQEVIDLIDSEESD
jgi:hypothetical protein